MNFFFASEENWILKTSITIGDKRSTLLKLALPYYLYRNKQNTTEYYMIMILILYKYRNIYTIISEI